MAAKHHHFTKKMPWMYCQCDGFPCQVYMCETEGCSRNGVFLEDERVQCDAHTRTRKKLWENARAALDQSGLGQKSFFVFQKPTDAQVKEARGRMNAS